MDNNDDFVSVLHNIASRTTGYQEFAIISSSKLHKAANRIQDLVQLVRDLAYDVLDDPTVSEDTKMKAREALGSI